MDNPGWHAQRRAKKEDEFYRYQYEHGGHHGHEQVQPMDEQFIGGFRRQGPPAPMGPPLPPKDLQMGPAVGPSFPPQTTITPGSLSQLSAVERSQTLRYARMEPHLQFMCGPLLKYDTIDERGTWHGAALIVTSDAGSIYDPSPMFTYSWDPDQPVPRHNRSESMAGGWRPGQEPSFYEGSTYSSSTLQTQLAPHPADPHSTVLSADPTFSPPQDASFNTTPSGFPSPQDGIPYGPKACSQAVAGQELWVYGGDAGSTFTFWRFDIWIPLSHGEMHIRYSVNNGQQMEFWVPGRNQNMRWAAHSCNGFSAGVNQDDFRGPGFQSGFDPVWTDLLTKHAERPFHVLVGGGDQLYCDSLMREAEMQDWVSKMKPEERKAYVLSHEMEIAIDRFFFQHYCQEFRRGAFARANSSIPMANMCDDHGKWSDVHLPAIAHSSYRSCAPKSAVLRLMDSTDLTLKIDGFGSYPDDMQQAPVFRRIGARGYFFFLLFQCFINVEVDGTSDLPGRHLFQSTVLGDRGPYVGFPSHSFLSRLGPQEYLLLLDCRAERKKEQVCSPLQYQRVFDRLNNLPIGVEHLIIQTGVPIAYPRMVFLESALESKFNPLTALGRSGALGLSGFVNKFNAEAELLDDLNDHWTARGHKRERNWFIEQLQNFARVKRIRVTFLSGDVHCAAVGVLKTLKGKTKQAVDPSQDCRYMLNVVTSAIVNTPPPNPVITMVSSLATKQHKTMHYCDTDESMIPLFATEPKNGAPRKQKFIMGARNWCRVERDDVTGDMIFDIRVEKERGHGATQGYVVRTPPPRW